MAKAINAEPIIARLKGDKVIAASVRREVGNKLGEGYADPVPMDITGAPAQLASFRRFKLNEQAALFEVKGDLFLRKVVVEVAVPKRGTEGRVYLITKGRVSAGVFHDDWTLIAWTMPLTEQIRDAAITAEVKWEHPYTGEVQRMRILERGTYDGTLLPKLTDVTYELGGKPIFIEDESQYLGGPAVTKTPVADQQVPEKKPEQEYRATTDFGLQEIIQQADPKQWRTLHLPFRDTVLVEGPPGSGKTSIGLMRVPCLIDRQWQELRRKPDVDPFFHDESTMVVLVMNEEMIDYLAKLIRSVGASGLPVQTMALFCRRLCRDGGTLGGRTVNESRLLSDLKHHPKAFSATWAGLLRSIDTFWSDGAKAFFDRFASINSAMGLDLVKRLSQWKAGVIGSKVPSQETPAPNLADLIRRWQTGAERTIPDPAVQPRLAETRRSEFNLMKEELGKFGRSLFDRRRLLSSMLTTPEGVDLLNAAGVRKTMMSLVSGADKTEGDVQQISEGDLLLHARLAAHLTLLRTDDKGLAFGGAVPNLTHIVIDEAQDISVDHVKLARSLLHPDGTLTLVGDLRQRVTHTGFFGDWNELDLGTCTRAVFTVNHRQSQPLGAFVADLHRCLFGAAPSWHPSKRLKAPKPRIRPKRGFNGLAALVAEEVRHWREGIPGATVGIIYHGQQWNRATHFARRIEDALGDTLTEVRVATSRDSGQLNRVDCAIIASVEVTKGLEFDAVVFIDRHQDWTGRVDGVDEVRRNGLYVACSRAKQGLSLILDDRCGLLAGALTPALFDCVPVPRTRSEQPDELEDFIEEPNEAEE